MRYSITLRLFSVALISTLCCQLAKSQGRPRNPESDPDCVPVQSMTMSDNTWNSQDRVFICQTHRKRFEIYSYGKEEQIVLFSSSNIVFKEQWALSIRFTIYKRASSFPFRCTFSQIEHAQAFYAKVNPDSKLSPNYFTSVRLDSCLLLQGMCQNRRTVTNDPLILHQHFIDSYRTKFTLEPAEGLGAEDLPPLTFLRGEFHLYRLTSEIIMTYRDNPSLCYILYFDDDETAIKFFDYMREFLGAGTNPEFENIPDDLD